MRQEAGFSKKWTVAALLCVALPIVALAGIPSRTPNRDAEKLLWELRLKACRLEEKSLTDSLRDENRQAFTSERELHEATISLEQAQQCRVEAELKVWPKASSRNTNARPEIGKPHGS